MVDLRCTSGALEAERTEAAAAGCRGGGEGGSQVRMRSSGVLCLYREREAPAQRGGLWSGLTLSGQEERRLSSEPQTSYSHPDLSSPLSDKEAGGWPLVLCS